MRQGSDRATQARWASSILIVAAVTGCDEPRGPTHAAPSSAHLSAELEAGPPPSSPSAPAPFDPFDGLTPARIDALESFGLCFEACRINLQCLAKRDPQGYPSVKAMAGDCQQTCLPAKLTKANPAETMGLRKCLKKLDCDAFDECAFGPPAPLKPPASAQPPTRP